MGDKSKNKSLIISKARELGFSDLRVSKARYLEEEAPLLEKWLNNSMHGQMDYMANHFDKRLDPTKLVPGAKTVITLNYNYYTEKKQVSGSPKISKYAHGQDYHEILKNKLRLLMSYIDENIGQIEGRVFTDSAPVLERAWARNSGIGWQGKNANIISPKNGSFYFLSEIISDLDLEEDPPITDHCGRCTACIDACPTSAIEAPQIINGSKCISYLTIELKDEIPKEFSGKMDDWFFGCDVCQDVCPWNRFSKQNTEELFEAQGNLLEMDRKEWFDISEEVYRTIFKKSPVKRTKFSGVKRNLNFLKNK